jgi:hypothetical protein
MFFVAEVKARPVLPQNETVRVAGNLPQRVEVAAVLCPINRSGQLAVGLQLVRLVRETVGVIPFSESCSLMLGAQFVLPRLLSNIQYVTSRLHSLPD